MYMYMQKLQWTYSTSKTYVYLGNNCIVKRWYKFTSKTVVRKLLAISGLSKIVLATHVPSKMMLAKNCSVKTFMFAK